VLVAYSSAAQSTSTLATRSCVMSAFRGRIQRV
jgi:hypothetical protein